MEPLTQEQTIQIKSWVDERDSILNDIAIKRDINAKLTANNVALAESNTDLSDRINASKVRLEEVLKKEEEVINRMSPELAASITFKAEIDSKIEVLEKDIKNLTSQKDLLIETINNYKDIYERVFERAEVLDKVVDHVTSVSTKNSREIEILLEGVKTSTQSIIDINKKNVEQSNYVISEMPKIFFALQREAPIKKTM